MGRVSASKSALLLSPCLRWAWEGAKEYEDEFADTSKRDMGTEFHWLMENYYGAKGDPKVQRRDPAYTDGDRQQRFQSVTTPWKQKAIAWSQEHLEPRCERLDAEVYVAINPTTGSVHHDPLVLARNYPEMPGYIPGTADLVCILTDGSLLVADWKTGGATGAAQQLRTLALGLRVVYALPDGSFRPIRVAVLYVGDDGVWPHEEEVSHEELETHRVSLGWANSDVGIRTDAVPGIHCTQLYCKHLAYCPGVSGTLEEAASEVVPPERLLRKRRRVGLGSDLVSQDVAGSIMERITAAKRQLTFHEARVQSYLANGGRCVAGEYEYSKGRDGHRWRPKK